MYDGIDREDSRETYFSGGLCLHFKGGGMRPGPWRHLGCKTGDTSFIPPQRDFFFTLQNEDTSLCFYFSKESLRRRGETTVPFFLSKHAVLYLTYRGCNCLKYWISFSSCFWVKSWHQEEPEWYYLLIVCMSIICSASKKLTLTFSMLINTDIKILAMCETVSESQC